jgi:hypothetical protein
LRRSNERPNFKNEEKESGERSRAAAAAASEDSGMDNNDAVRKER